MNKLVLDWFRNKDGDNGVLLRNAGWLQNFLYSTGLVDNSSVEPSDNIRRVESVYKASGMAMNQHSWAYLYDNLERISIAHDFFLESCSSELVIGYELSRAQLQAIDKAGKRYINLCTHPLRFAPDYFLAAATNDPQIHSRLKSVAPTRDYIEQNVGLMKARAARRYHRRMNPEQGLVFFAQIAVDSSRIKNGEIIDDSYIIQSLERTLDEMKPKNLYLKHHPHEKMSSALTSALEKMKGKVIPTETYDLLSISGLRLCALSSGICHEAAYFGCKPTKFLPNPELFPILGEEIALGQYNILPSNIIDKRFWEYVLKGAECPAPVYPLPNTPYRTASGLSWG
ncbi:hypothetical protein SOX05_20550 [Pseudomonas putida]|uniref:hypothetical protein n=1 Tax=unclassified Pseudomonas TaxID=196821 RepID=UPI0025568847|nr:hypothetical protein [Pseudomonas sp. M2(2023)]MDY4312262.1 hypothetical protein [Pseudomonas putida]MDY4322548.1 hypothetical protein [Pseudomonas putida]MDY4355938.1 hypothetical protein [Pseudomonas putida]WIV25323.1 hypothetical protein QN085_06870 [Pseudomonas sp. M2(2023)]